MLSEIKKILRVGLLSLTTLTVFSFQEVSAKELSKAEITCLTKNAYHEAGNQGEKGILATVFVVLNRTKDSRFPSSPCRVIAQPSQFSWWGKGKVVKDHKTYKEIEGLVKEVVSGKHRDVTQGSVFFHSTKVKPSWCSKVTKTVKIGDHVFYK